MGAGSSTLIAFGFLAQVATGLEPFVIAVLPAVFLLGEFTSVALLRHPLENFVLLQHIQRIRLLPRLPPGGEPALRLAKGDEMCAAAMGSLVWGKATGVMVTAASAIAAINRIIGGIGLALLAARVASLRRTRRRPIGIAAALVLFGLNLL